MNIKKLALLTVLALSAATVRTEAIVMDDQLWAVQDFPQSSEIVQEIAQENEVVTQEETTQKNTPVMIGQIWNPCQNNDDWPNKYSQYVHTTIIPGVGVGLLTGTSIGYMSGTLFDAIVNPITQGKYAFFVAPSRLAAQIGSKWYWEKPLRHKLLNWIQTNIKSMYTITWDGYNVHPTEVIDESLCNEECGKTLARLCAWIGLVTQVKSF